MRVLIVEDDFVTRKLLLRMLSEHGRCDVAVNGLEAVEAFRQGWEEREPYDLVCMDIMMPHMSGIEALTKIRSLERERGIKPAEAARAIMITSLTDPKNVSQAFYHGEALSYLVKPVDRRSLVAELRKIGLLD